MLKELPELSWLRVLHGLDLDAVQQLLEQCEEVGVPAGELLMVEGEEDRAMAFVLAGQLEVYVGAPPHVAVVRQVPRGEHVGELSVLGLADRRSASVRAVEPSRLLVLEPAGLDRLRALGHPFVDNLEEEVLRELAQSLRETDRMLARLAVGTALEPAAPHGLWERLARAMGVDDRPWGAPPDLVEVLRSSREFDGLPGPLAEHLHSKLEPIAVHSGERVIEEGGLGRDAYILASGEVGVYRATRSGRHERVGSLQAGTVFGHLAIIDGALCTATCIMESPGWLFRVPRAMVSDVVHKRSDAARALRWGFLRALASQLRQANESLSHLAAKGEDQAGEGFAGEQLLSQLGQARLAAVGPA